MEDSKKKISNSEFERSSELKRLFNELSEEWFRKTRLGMSDLAERCGVSVQYISHVGRYGRVPSKPILTLIAFNLSPNDPVQLFRAAGLKDTWPYENGIGLRPRSATESGLLSINLDMNGFVNVIRDVVRTEIQPKKLEDLLGNRPLKVGLNSGQFFLFNNKTSLDGFFTELIRTIALSLHCEVEFVDVPHSDFGRMLETGQIDCYGPIYKTASRLTHALFSSPFCRVAISGLGRVRKSAKLIALPPPQHISDLRKNDYIIAVHKDSMAHHFLEGELAIPTSRIIACDVSEEAVERVVLATLPRPAHLMLTDLPFASKIHREHPSTTQLLFDNSNFEAPPFEDTIAVRTDWPSLLSSIDQTLSYLSKNGTLARIAERTAPEIKSIGVGLV